MSKPKQYEFGGPIGTGAISLILTPVVYFFAIACNEKGCPPSTFYSDPVGTVKALYEAAPPALQLEPFLYFLGYLGMMVGAHLIFPGLMKEGVPLPDGKRLTYKLNAFPIFIAILCFAGGMTYLEGPEWAVWVYITDHILQLAMSAAIVSTSLAVFLYIKSFIGEKILSVPGNQGNHIHDFFLGRELNPRIGSFDLKEFCELYPGLMGWVILNLAFAAKQYRNFGYLSDSMLLVNGFHFWYVFDALYNEPAVLTTMDIVTDGFGLMLTYGDITWVPFTYTLQSRYLAAHPVHLGVLGVAGVLSVQALGYYIFRSANGQKDKFRRDPKGPEVKHLKYMETAAGSKLLISGWWGTARHINYLGDWIMGWAWCLPTGFNTPMTYFYVIYFGILLLHRETRDEHKCKTKYGEDWEKYKRQVPWRIIPFIY